MLTLNPELRNLIQPAYSLTAIEGIRDLLFKRGTLSFSALPNGLFPAVSLSQSMSHTGYHSVWVRDNVHVAHSLLENGEPSKAAKAVLAMANHFCDQSARFDVITTDPSRAADPAARPHVKFEGHPIQEIPGWAHDQNDALGYFLWIFSRMIRLGYIPLSEEHRKLLARFPPYFQAIRYWLDKDSGHWEEARKNGASSVGAVCAALRELKDLLRSDRLANLRSVGSLDLVERLLETGLQHLHSILPAECIEDPPSRRRYDAALLFLVYPLAIVDDAMADQISGDVRKCLQGDQGIKRYVGDSFWCANYRRNIGPNERTRDFSSDMPNRDRFLKPGTEAQWCLFDPILSVIFGRRYESSRAPKWLAIQTEYFNRALSQLTADFRCPELWHWETADDGTPFLDTSDSTPLLWTQANLWLAVGQMVKSLQLVRR